ncbi:hypothetical protein V6Z11_A13G153800 [Gossypium hirsutum]
MAENQGNQLPSAIAANQNPAPRTMYDYAKPSLTGTESSIVRPAVAANTFELKPNTIQMIQQFVQFNGLQDKDPNAHLANFLELCDTFKINGVSDDAICLRLFPFSLRNKAKQWLNSLPRKSITTWEQMTEKFLLKNFPPAKIAKLCNDISSFVQMDLETLYDAWERYKDLLRRYPHHGLSLWLQVQTFHNGLNPSTRQMVDVAAGGTINNKTPEDAYEFIEEMSLNNYQWQVMRTKPTKTAGIYNVDSVTLLSNQVELLNKKIDGFLNSSQVHPVMQCEASGGAQGPQVQKLLEWLTGQHTVPNVFIGGKHIGGCTVLREAKTFFKFESRCNFILNNVIEKVLLLTRRREKYLVVAAVRFVRTILTHHRLKSFGRALLTTTLVTGINSTMRFTISKRRDLLYRSQIIM